MTKRLFTPADLAEIFSVTEETVMDWRRLNNWPHVKVGRTFRFTADQVDAIVARHTQAPKLQAAGQPPVLVTGQTKRSAARAS